MQIRHDTPATQHADKVMQLLKRVNEHSSPTKNSDGNPFADLMVGGLSRVNNMQNQAESQIEQLLAGEDVNQAEVFTNVQKADMSFRMLVQIRNRLMQAYEEINSIRV